MIRVYNSKDKGTLERLWDGQIVDYLVGLFTLRPETGTIIKDEK